MKVAEAEVVKEATIYITEVDRKRLEKLVEIAGGRDRRADHEYLRKLEHELDRAETVSPEEVPGDLITMRSKVRLKDMNTGEEMVYTLVFPAEADSGSGPLTLGIEKRKAKCGLCRLSWLATEPISLRLPCAAPVAEGGRATSFITAPTAPATGRANCGGARGAADARRGGGARPSST